MPLLDVESLLMPFVFLAFVLVPLAEIGLFIEVGGLIGLWPTLFIVILTAFMGTALLRAQGLAALTQAQAQMAEGKLPMEQVVHGFCLVTAGALLLTPGFLTDTIGFLLFVPAVRMFLGRRALAWLAERGSVQVFTGRTEGPSPSRGNRDDIVDGVAEEIDPGHPDKPILH